MTDYQVKTTTNETVDTLTGKEDDVTSRYFMPDGRTSRAHELATQLNHSLPEWEERRSALSAKLGVHREKVSDDAVAADVLRTNDPEVWDATCQSFFRDQAMDIGKVGARRCGGEQQV